MGISKDLERIMGMAACAKHTDDELKDLINRFRYFVLSGLDADDFANYNILILQSLVNCLVGKAAQNNSQMNLFLELLQDMCQVYASVKNEKDFVGAGKNIVLLIEGANPLAISIKKLRLYAEYFK